MKKIVFIISFWLMLLGATTAILLSSIPFGAIFKLSVMLFFLGAIVFFFLLSLQLVRSQNLWKKILGIPVAILFLMFGFISFALAVDNPTNYNRVANFFLSMVPESSRGTFSKFPYSLTKEEWRKDIAYLKTELPKHHAHPFLYMKQQDFYFAITQLETKLDKLSDNEIAFEICRIVSLIKDGHTQVMSVAFGIPAFVDTRLFPFRIFFFTDGVYITDGGREYKELEGYRIKAIGEISMEEVFKRVSPFIPGENEHYKMQWAFPYLLNSGLLKYVGVINTESAEFTFIDASGKEVKKNITPIHSMAYLRWFRETLMHDDISRRGALKKNYWYEYDKKSNTIFLQVNQINNQQGGVPIKDFAEELNEFIHKNEVAKMIIDARNCNGGDNSTMGPLINLFVNNSKINQPGMLFTLIGRQTFSAGISFVSSLERNTKTIFVGESSGSGPNQSGDAQTFILPISKLVMQVSSRYHQQSFGKDRRLQITPALQVKYTYQNWKDNIDPALSILHNYKFALPTVNKIIEPQLYTGRYFFDSDRILTIKYENNILFYNIEGARQFAKNELINQGDNLLTDNSGLVNLQFIEKGNNGFQKIYLGWGNGHDTLNRVPENYFSPAELLKQGKYHESVAIYRQAKTNGVVFSASTEGEINRIGYLLVAQNKLEEAILLFTLNTELFPFSGNTWDSLAETYLKMGNTEKAKLFYRNSLQMNPENNGAKLALKNL